MWARDDATYEVQVVGAFALAADMSAWDFELDQKFFLASPVTGTVKRAGGGDLKLYAGVPTTLKVSFAEGWSVAPKGLHAFGQMRFRDTRTDDRRPGDEGGRLVLEVPLSAE